MKIKKRVDILGIMKDLNKWDDLMIRCIISAQALEGITTTYEQARKAWEGRKRDEKN